MYRSDIFCWSAAAVVLRALFSRHALYDAFVVCVDEKTLCTYWLSGRFMLSAPALTISYRRSTAGQLPTSAHAVVAVHEFKHCDFLYGMFSQCRRSCILYVRKFLPQ